MLPSQWRIHNVFHTSLLTPYKETEEYGDNFMQPPLELINGQEEYEVEQIMNSRQIGHTQKLQYLLHWKGYSHAGTGVAGQAVSRRAAGRQGALGSVT
jgi:hypothetical protein